MGNKRSYVNKFNAVHKAMGLELNDKGYFVRPTINTLEITEHELQKSIIQYCRLQNVLVFQTDIMDGLKFFSQNDPRRFNFISHHKAMGYIKGQPDLVVCLKDKVLFVELKTAKGKQSKEQKEFQTKCKELNLDYYVVRNIEEMQKIINDNKTLINVKLPDIEIKKELPKTWLDVLKSIKRTETLQEIADKCGLPITVIISIKMGVYKANENIEKNIKYVLKEMGLLC